MSISNDHYNILLNKLSVLKMLKDIIRSIFIKLNKCIRWLVVTHVNNIL